jgi:hypothetical protein
MARYLEQQQRTLDTKARLRAQRLALYDKSDPANPVKKTLEDSTPRRSLRGLHQGIRE